MAKSPRIGENRGRRAAGKRRPAEAQEQTAEAGQSTADDRSISTVLQTGGQGGVTKDQIEARAYQLYLARGGTDGYDMDDWLKAERELLRRR